MGFFEPYKHGYLLRVKLSPGASSCGFRGLFADVEQNLWLKVSITTVPEKGKANKELIKMLAKELKLSQSLFEIVSGITDHMKKIYIENTDSAIYEKLQQLEKGLTK